MENFIYNPKISYRVVRGDESYAPLSFLVPFIGFLGILKIKEYFSLLLTPTQKEVKYSAVDKAMVEITSIAALCTHTSHINTKLKNHKALANLIGLEDFPDQSTINRLLNSLEMLQVHELGTIHTSLLQRYGIFNEKDKVVVDIDGTGIAVRGEKFEFARKGYFPGQRGKKGYKLTVASVPSERGSEVLTFTFDPGNIPENSRFSDVLYGALEALGGKEKLECVRMDRKFGTGEIISLLMDEDIKFVTKVYDKRSVKRWFKEDIKWEEVSTTTWSCEVGFTDIPNCKHKVRVVLIKKGTKKGIEYDAILTNFTLLEKDTCELVNFYNRRQKIEAFFKEDKNCLGIKYLKVKHYEGIWGFLWFAFMTNNLLLWFRHYVLGRTPLKTLGFKSLYNVLQNIFIRVIREKSWIKIEFICFSDLQELFVKEALSWLQSFNLSPPEGVVMKEEDRLVEAMREVVYVLFLFLLFFHIIGRFEDEDIEKKRVKIEWLKKILST